MRNIEVVVDASGSADLNEIEKHLANMQMDPSLEKDNIQVSFLSFGLQLSKNLRDLKLPLDNEDTKKFFLGGDNFSRVINEKLQSKPDALVFISDYMDLPIDGKLVNPVNTKIMFVCTQRDPQVEQFFLADVKDLPNVKSSNTDKYTSVNTLFNDLLINDRISKLRFSNSKDSDSKLKP
jgi:predicted metal-dependent peptidase